MPIVAESDAPMPASVKLPDKDHPILKAAIAAEATHLISGDVKDFGRYFGTRIARNLIDTPADFIRPEGGCFTVRYRVRFPNDDHHREPCQESVLSASRSGG